LRGGPGKTLSRRKSIGRFPRSVEMITQRPVIGSLRNSGKGHPPGHAFTLLRGRAACKPYILTQLSFERFWNGWMPGFTPLCGAFPDPLQLRGFSGIARDSR
jgi:hypothetical protein